MIIRENSDYLRVPLYSYYATIAGSGVLLSAGLWDLRLGV